MGTHRMFDTAIMNNILDEKEDVSNELAIEEAKDMTKMKNAMKQQPEGLINNLKRKLNPLPPSNHQVKDCGFEIERNQKGGFKVVKEGYVYHMKKQTKKQMKWTCMHRKGKKCSAYLLTDNDI